MRNLFPVTPRYRILKTKYYTAYRSWFESSLQRRAIRSSPLHVWKTPPFVIYYNKTLHICQRICARFGIYFFLTYENTNGSPLTAVNATAHAKVI